MASLEHDALLLNAAIEIAGVRGKGGIAAAVGDGVADILAPFLPTVAFADRARLEMDADVGEAISRDCEPFELGVSDEARSRLRFARRYISGPGGGRGAQLPTRVRLIELADSSISADLSDRYPDLFFDLGHIFSGLGRRERIGVEIAGTGLYGLGFTYVEGGVDYTKMRGDLILDWFRKHPSDAYKVVFVSESAELEYMNPEVLFSARLSGEGNEDRQPAWKTMTRAEIEDKAVNLASELLHAPADDLPTSRPDLVNKESWWWAFGPLWGSGFHLAFAILPPLVVPVVLDEFNRLKIRDARGPDALRAAMKVITGFAKKYGNLAYEDVEDAGATIVTWKFFINWDLLGDYVRQGSFEEVVEEVTDWVAPVEHTAWDPVAVRDTGERFDELFREGVRHALSQCLPEMVIAANRAFFTPAEFAKRPYLLAGSGSSSARSSTVYEDADGKRRRVRKSKSDWVFNITEAQILRMLVNPGAQALKLQYKIVFKAERGKMRPVVAATNEDYARQRYVLSWFTDAARNHPHTTLTASNRAKADLWLRIRADVANANVVQMPLDQSHFDHMQSLSQIAIVLEEMARFADQRGSAEVKRWIPIVIGHIIHSLVTVPGTIKIDMGPGKVKTIQIEGGVMSGWGLTAWLDTFINLGTLYAAAKTSEFFLGNSGLVGYDAQGDDDQTTLSGYGEAIALWFFYRRMNFDVNPSKFFIASDRDEYLRRVVTRDGWSGYMVRAVGSLLTRDPTTREQMQGILRVQEQVQQWGTVIARGADEPTAFSLMLQDVSGANGLPIHTVLEVFMTPACVGGMGVHTPSLREYRRRNSNRWLALSEGRAVRTAPVVTNVFPSMYPVITATLALGVQVEMKQVVDILAAEMEMPFAKVDVVPGSVEIVQKFEPLFFDHWNAFGAARLACSAFSDTRVIPAPLSGYILEQMLAAKRDEDVTDVWLDPLLRVASRRIKQRGGRRVWISWLKGDLPFRSPRILAVDPSIIAIVFDDLSQRCWAALSMRNHFNMTSVRRAALRVEEMTVHQVTLDTATLHMGY